MVKCPTCRNKLTSVEDTRSSDFNYECLVCCRGFKITTTMAGHSVKEVHWYDPADIAREEEIDRESGLLESQIVSHELSMLEGDLLIEQYISEGMNLKNAIHKAFTRE